MKETSSLSVPLLALLLPLALGILLVTFRLIGTPLQTYIYPEVIALSSPARENPIPASLYKCPTSTMVCSLGPIHIVQVLAWSQIISANTTSKIVVGFEPITYEFDRKEDSGSGRSSYWEQHTVSEMRVCISADEPCQLSERWIPFAPNVAFNVNGDWTGNRGFWVLAQFRDRDGAVVPVNSSIDYFPAPDDLRAFGKTPISLTVNK